MESENPLDAVIEALRTRRGGMSTIDLFQLAELELRVERSRKES